MAAVTGTMERTQKSECLNFAKEIAGQAALIAAVALGVLAVVYIAVGIPALIIPSLGVSLLIKGALCGVSACIAGFANYHLTNKRSWIV